METKRFNIDGFENGMVASADGSWIHVDDHAAALSTRDARIAELEAKHALLAAEVRAWRDWKKRVVRYMTCEMPDPTPQIEELKRAAAATDEARALEEHPSPDGSTNPSAANLSTGQLVAIVTLDRIKALEAERDALRAALDAEREAVKILGDCIREVRAQRTYEHENNLVPGGAVSSAMEQACRLVMNNPIAAAAVKGTPNGEA